MTNQYLMITIFVSFSAYECQPGKFQCAGIEAMSADGCIPEIYLCDGHEDCEDGHDEKGCEGIFILIFTDSVQRALNCAGLNMFI